MELEERIEKAKHPVWFEPTLKVFLMDAQVGGDPGIFLFSCIFSHNGSALDHSATLKVTTLVVITLPEAKLSIEKRHSNPERPDESENDSSESRVRLIKYTWNTESPYFGPTGSIP